MYAQFLVGGEMDMMCTGNTEEDYLMEQRV